MSGRGKRKFDELNIPGQKDFLVLGIEASVGFTRSIIAYEDTLDGLRREFVSFGRGNVDKCSRAKYSEMRNIGFGAEI